ncbi:MAG: DNA repair protein RecO [Bacillota bacterium]|nr:DNA repair protein RecO [Bacillota bacterium]
MTIREVSALVLDCEDFKEKDAIVSLLVEEEIIRVYARGINKITSKNRMLCQPFSRVNITIDQKGERMPLLIHGNVEKYYFRIQESLVAQTVCSVLRDIIKKSHVNHDTFVLVESVWSAFHTGEANVYTKACILLKEILMSEGIGIQVEGCVNCSRKNKIETISLLDGGFLCTECNANRYPKRSKQELIQYYSLMHVGKDKQEEFFDTFLFTVDDFIFIANWFEHYTYIALPSLRLLKSIKSIEL